MRILLQNSLFWPHVIGGAEISSHLLGEQLRARGHDVHAVASTGRHGRGRQLNRRPTADGRGTVFEADAHGLYDIFSDQGPPAPPGMLVRGLHHFSGVTSPRWKKLMGQVLDEVRPAVLHTNTLVGLTPVIWQAAAARKIPVVHTLRDYHLLCPRTTLLRSDHTDCTRPPLPCRLLSSLKLRPTRLVRVVTAPSRFVLDKHLLAGGFANANAEVVPNAVEAFPADAPERGHGPASRGLYLGQLDLHKGVGLLLESLAQLLEDPDLAALQFDFAGTGPLVTRVEAFCAAHPDRVRYHGLVQGAAKSELLRRADWLTVPSVWNDNFPRSILDGFSWQLPVIGTTRGGIPEVIRHDRDGLVVPPEVASLKTAITRYVTDPATRLAHGQSARARADDYTLDGQIDRFEAIYTQLVGNGRTR